MKKIFLFSLLCFVVGCETTTNQGQVSLRDQMTHSYCYQYMYGDYGSEIDYQKALTWCGKSVITGNPSAMALLGEIYFFGLGRKVDYKKSYYWYEKAANKNHAHAQFMLAHHLSRGLGVAPSKTQALQWQKRAARNPDIKAKVALTSD